MSRDSSREHLLKNRALLHPDCPGCRIAHLRDDNAGPPVKLLLYLGYILLSNCLPISVLYPFVYFMVKDFNVAKSDEDIGYYAGWIGSSFMAGRMVTGMVWGAIADRYGRKPVMYGGLVTVLVFNTMFGMSSNFWMALVTRFILGGFNGMLGTLKAYASEIVSEEHQALGQSVVGTAWGLGLIIGPALGGFLAQPALKYPNLFKEGTLFARYPYLLQALCVSSFSVVGLLVCTQLPESLHNHNSTAEVVSDESSMVEQESRDEHKVDIPVEQKAPQKSSIFRNHGLMAATALYCLWSLHDIAYTEVFSLWAVSPKSYGGLSFTSSEVGSVLAVAGFAMLVFQLTVFPPATKLIGAIRAARIGALFTIPLLCAYPFFCKIQGVWLYVVVYTASIIKYVLTTGTMIGSFILINNSVKQHQRGAANGFSLSVVSLFKAIGPASAGVVFAWSQTRRKAAILPGDELVFFFLNVFALLAALATLEPFMPKSVNKLAQEDYAQ